jgi:hypothetical protein
MALAMSDGQPGNGMDVAADSVVTSRFDEANLCRNCGALAMSKFCPECGQSTKVGIPRLVDLFHDGLGAMFSYDAKLWRTVVVLVTKPGQLTVDYIDGKRARYLTPFQLFFWLEALTFLAHRLFFSKNPVEIDLKTKALLIIGGVVVAGLAVLNAPRKMKFVAHLIAGTHIWSFLMLLLLVEYTVVPGLTHVLQWGHILSSSFDVGSYLTLIAQVAMVVYLVLSIHRTYGKTYWTSILQAAVLFGLYEAVARVIDRIWI